MRSKSSPLAVWVATSPSAALDRASAQRGYAHSLSPFGIPNGWDCRVVIAFRINIEECGLNKTLPNGVQLRRYLTGNRQIVPLRELNVVECMIPKQVYDRFQQLHLHWHDLQTGKEVLCRARRKYPEDFFRVVAKPHGHAAAQPNVLKSRAG